MVVVEPVGRALCAVASQDRARKTVIGAWLADVGGRVVDGTRRATRHTRFVIVDTH